MISSVAPRSLRGRTALALVAILFSSLTPAAPTTVEVSGGSAANPTDITAFLISNTNLVLNGGNFAVNLPAGVGTIPASSADVFLTRHVGTGPGNSGFSAPDNPTIIYSGTISGTGSILVRSSFDSTPPDTSPPAPGAPQLFTGGVLMFTNPSGQTWGVAGESSGAHNTPALTIAPNATVSFFFPGTVDDPAPIGAPTSDVFPRSTTVSRNVVNDGFLYSSAANNWGSITGTGVISFVFWGGDDGHLTTGSFYSASAMIVANGLKMERAATIENQPDGSPTNIIAPDIMVFQTGGQSLLDPKSFAGGTDISVSQNIRMQGLDLQLWNNGIAQFSGILLPPVGSENYLDFAPVAEGLKGMFLYGAGSFQGFGRDIYVQNGTKLLMGDGRSVSTTQDGITSNVFLQGNPFNTLISVNLFVGAPPGPSRVEAVAYAYSGSYHINHNFNAAVNGSTGTILGIAGTDWVDLFIFDPTKWNAKAREPNHAIVTAPIFFAGLTQIDNNAILQLGDGTVGNDVAKKTIVANGQTYTSRYNDSMGDGMLMTKGNQSLLKRAELMNAGINFQIVNNGQLIVNNTLGSLSATVAGDSASPGSSPDVAAWIAANELDGITGTGSVQQLGTRPLTLGAPSGNPNTYSGGTRIGPNAKLFIGSATALGVKSTAPQSGSVTNSGVLACAPGTRTINVPGDYSQLPTP